MKKRISNFLATSILVVFFAPALTAQVQCTPIVKQLTAGDCFFNGTLTTEFNFGGNYNELFVIIDPDGSGLDTFNVNTYWNLNIGNHPVQYLPVVNGSFGLPCNSIINVKPDTAAMSLDCQDYTIDFSECEAGKWIYLDDIQFSLTGVCPQLPVTVSVKTSMTSPVFYDSIWVTPGPDTEIWFFVHVWNHDGNIIHTMECLPEIVLITDQDPELDANIIGSDDVCMGEEVALNAFAFGGSAPYTYLWNTGGATTQGIWANGGIYSVTVTDADNCTTVADITVTPLSVDLLAIPFMESGSCNGNPVGSLSANATGGSGNYSYEWFPSGQTTATAVNLIPGDYVVTVTDNATGCTTTGLGIVTNLANALLTVDPIHAVCASSNSSSTGSVNFFLVNGTLSQGPFIVEFNGQTYTQASSQITITGLTPGTYIYTAYGAGTCPSSGQVTILNNSGTGNPLTGILWQYDFDWQNPVPSCQVPSGKIEVKPVGGTAVYFFQWVQLTGFGGGTPASGSTNIIFGDEWKDIHPIANQGRLPAGLYQFILTDALGCQVTTNALIGWENPLALTTSVNGTALCHNSLVSANAVATGGMSTNYTYVWSYGGQTGPNALLPIGNHSVTVTDGIGCQVTNSLTITGAAPIQITATVTPTTCNANDGSITVVTNAINPIVSLNGAPVSGFFIQGLDAGNYEIAVTDINGCTNSTIATVGQIDITPTITATTVNQACQQNTGEITFVTNSQFEPYVWYFNGSGFPDTLIEVTSIPTVTFTDLNADEYSVIMVDAKGCVAELNAVVHENTPVQVNVNLNGCSGNPTINVSGGVGPYLVSVNGNGFNYTESTNGTLQLNGFGLVGTYTVSVYDARNCFTWTTFTVNAAVTFDYDFQDASCVGGGIIEIFPSGGNGTYNYSWTGPGNLIQNSPYQENLPGGIYSVTVTSSGCSHSESIEIFDLGGLVVNGQSFWNSVENSAELDLTVVNGTGPFFVEIIHTSGAVVQSFSFTGSTYTTYGIAPWGSQNAGMYSVIVTDANGCIDDSGWLSVWANNGVVYATYLDVGCGFIHVNASGGFPGYKFVTNGQEIIGDQNTNFEFNNLPEGFHEVKIYDRLDGPCCWTYAGSWFFDVTCGSTTAVEFVPVNAEGVNMTVYPNPATTEAIIKSDLNGQVQIYSVNGQLVHEHEDIKNTTEKRIEFDLPSGVYIIKLYSEDKFVSRKLTIIR